jgi:hypothetical protein
MELNGFLQSSAHESPAEREPRIRNCILGGLGTEVAAKSLCSGRGGHQNATNFARQPKVSIIFRAYSDLRVSPQASGLLISTIVSGFCALKPVAR